MNPQQLKSDALSVVDAALAILNKFPSLDNLDQGISLGTSLNPFPFLLELFKTTSGYNMLVEIVSKFLVYELPVVEVAVKGVILSQLKNMLTCSLNPFVTNELLRNGVVFDVDQLDLTDILKHSPLECVYLGDDKDGQPITKRMGQFYYFGLDNVEIPDDLKDCKDFNALIWYMKNRATQRIVWNDKAKRKITHEILDSEKKLQKKDGTVTLDFHERSSALTTSEGNSYAAQVPMNNCLHVYIGNVKPLADGVGAEGIEKQKEAQEIDRLINELKHIILKADKQIDKNINHIVNEVKESDPNYIVEKETCDASNKTLEKYFITNTSKSAKKNDILSLEELQKKLNTLKGYCDSVINNTLSLNPIPEPPEDMKYDGGKKFYDSEWLAKQLIYHKNQNILWFREKREGHEFEYPPIEKNFYYHRTIFEFGYDFVKSIQLFDSRVLAAQLIEQLLGTLDFSIGFELTAKEYFIREEIKKMLKMVIETDDATVSDCFFAFSNDEYNSMLHDAELKYAGVAPMRGSANPKQYDTTAILESLSMKNVNAQEAGEIHTAVKGALQELSGLHNELGRLEEGTTIGATGFVSANILDAILDNLAYTIVTMVLSPKVYLLILFNLQVIGKATSFSLEGFINQYTQLITNLLRMVRDQLIQYLMKELMDLLAQIAQQIAVKITVEQAHYYAELIKRCIACFRRFKGQISDWTMDNVQHADIESSTSDEEVTKTC